MAKTITKVIDIKKDDELYVYRLVGINLKKQRKLKKLSIVKFAMLCNYTEGFIRNIESPNYLQTFSLGTLWHFASVLGVNIKVFFEEEDTKKAH